MLDWLVIGGGPHGVHAAARLIGEAGISRDKVRILDDEADLARPDGEGALRIRGCGSSVRHPFITSISPPLHSVTS